MWARGGGPCRHHRRVDCASGGVRNERELADARAQCRRLAVTNEFAINGHENRISYIVGAGHQAGFQLRAAARVRRFERVIAWNLHPDMLPKLGAVAAELGLPETGFVFCCFNAAHKVTRYSFERWMARVTPCSSGWAGTPRCA